MSPIPTNTFTVTIADTHAHSVADTGVDGSNKLDAVSKVLEGHINELLTGSGTPIAALLTADTWTITITQP
jgi:hypothetical protein